ncbi:MAG: hypothetical protein ACW99G_22395 [Candidatus Thorarchaeota archaeon]|jgi:hypothetical protein
MRYKKVLYHDKDDALRELGCKSPGSTEWYSYYNTEPDIIRYQSCVGLYTSLKTHVKKQYQHVQHFARHVACKDAKEVLCVRYTHDRGDYNDPDWVVITAHAPGECPLCNYHTKEEYHDNMEERGLL